LDSLLEVLEKEEFLSRDEGTPALRELGSLFDHRGTTKDTSVEGNCLVRIGMIVPDGIPERTEQA